MVSKTELKARLEFRQEALTEARAAYVALLNGQVQSYSIGSRSLTRFDLPKLWEMILEMEKEVDGLEAQVSGGKRRRAVSVLPRDW